MQSFSIFKGSLWRLDSYINAPYLFQKSKIKLFKKVFEPIGCSTHPELHNLSVDEERRSNQSSEYPDKDDEIPATVHTETEEQSEHKPGLPLRDPGPQGADHRQEPVAGDSGEGEHTGDHAEDYNQEDGIVKITQSIDAIPV